MPREYFQWETREDAEQRRVEEFRRLAEERRREAEEARQKKLAAERRYMPPAPPRLTITGAPFTGKEEQAPAATRQQAMREAFWQRGIGRPPTRGMELAATPLLPQVAKPFERIPVIGPRLGEYAAGMTLPLGIAAAPIALAQPELTATGMLLGATGQAAGKGLERAGVPSVPVGPVNIGPATVLETAGQFITPGMATAPGRAALRATGHGGAEAVQEFHALLTKRGIPAAGRLIREEAGEGRVWLPGRAGEELTPAQAPRVTPPEAAAPEQLVRLINDVPELELITPRMAELKQALAKPRVKGRDALERELARLEAQRDLARSGQPTTFDEAGNRLDNIVAELREVEGELERRIRVTMKHSERGGRRAPAFGTMEREEWKAQRAANEAMGRTTPVERGGAYREYSTPWLEERRGVLTEFTDNAKFDPVTPGEEPLVGRARFTETGEMVQEPTYATEGELGGVRPTQGRMGIGAGERPLETAGPMFEKPAPPPGAAVGEAARPPGGKPPPPAPPTGGGRELPDFEPWLGEAGARPKPLTMKREPQTPAVRDLTGAYLERAGAKAQTAARKEAAGFEPWLGEAETFPSRKPLADRDLIGETLDQVDNLPDRVVPVASRKRFPTLQQYDTQLANAKEAVTSARARLKALRKVQGAGLEGRNTQAEKDLVNAVKQRKTALGAMHEAEIRVTMDDIVKRARAAGADETAVKIVRQAYEDAVKLIPKAESLLEAGALRQHIARLSASFQGTPPGVVGQLAAQRSIVQEALRQQTAKVVSELGKSVDSALAKELPNIKYVGPAKWAKYIEAAKGQVLIQHPEWFKGVSPDLMRLMNQAQTYQRAKLAIAEAMGYPIKALEGPYLEQMWKLPRSPLETPVPRIPGKVSIARQRAFGDYLEGMAQGFEPAEMSVGELIEHSSNLMDQAIADAFMRRQVLQRFGTRVQKALNTGYRRFGHPLYQGWSGPSPISNFVDQLYAPAGPTAKRIANLSAAIKNSVFGIGDVAVFGVNILDALATGGPRLMAGLVNRSLALLHAPHVGLMAEENLPRVVRFAMDGVHQGMGPSAVTLKGGTILKYIPYVGKYLDIPTTATIDALARIQFGMILTPIRNMLHEGNLVTLHLLGEDITSPAVRRAAADMVNAWTGASRGALVPGRRAAETIGLTSFQMTRAEMARLAQIAKALGPGATRAERLMAAMTLTTFGASVYGLGSAINMAFGNGPIEFNPAKSDWATVKVGGQNVALVQRAAIIRAIGKSVHILEGENISDLGLVWAQVVGGKSSPLAGIPEAAAGFGFEPKGGYQAGTLSAKGRLLNMAPMPPTVETLLTEPESRGALPMVLTATGVRSWPVSPYQHLKDLVPGWPDMLPGQREEAAQKNPEVRKWWNKQLEQGSPEAKATQQAADDFGAGMVAATKRPGVVYSEITDAFDKFRASQWAKGEIYYAGVEFKNDSPDRKLLEGFYAFYDLLPPVPTAADWDEVRDKQDAYIEANPGVTGLIKLNEKAVFSDPAAQAIADEINAARDVQKELYAIPAYLGLSSDEGQTVSRIIERADGMVMMGQAPSRKTAIYMMAEEFPSRLLAYALKSGKLTNPARRRFKEENIDALKWFEDIQLEEPALELAGVR